MSAQSILRVTLISACCLGLTACSIFERSRAEREAEQALEKEALEMQKEQVRNSSINQFT